MRNKQKSFRNFTKMVSKRNFCTICSYDFLERFFLNALVCIAFLMPKLNIIVQSKAQRFKQWALRMPCLPNKILEIKVYILVKSFVFLGLLFV
jgi:hypothetical protein